MVKNTIPDLATRIAGRALAERGAGYASEVRRLLDAALEVIRRNGPDNAPRVADIVATSGLSNEAFYRHFPSKAALVAALIEDGAERLASYLDHQMGKEASPEGKVRRWVEGVFSQTRGEIAATTVAVLGNGGGFGAAGRYNANPSVAAPLREAFSGLGSADPELAASLVAYAALGKVSEYLMAKRSPTRAELDRIVVFALGAARGC